MTVLLIYLISCTLIAGQSGGSGSISGTVRDIKTKSPLTGVNLQLIGTMNGAVSDENGVFKIERVSTGSQQIEASYLGYSTRIIADIIVKAGQSSQLIIELAEDVIQSETETVTASYFNESNTAVPSLTTFSREEIRRAPGAAGDISRIITSLPSIAKVDDQSNQLAVRGGNPIETTFFVDQIEIPNINHFPKQGSSGGPIGLINTEMIQSVDFQAAAFPAAYGDRLSAIMHIDFRDGDRESFRSRFNLDLSGAGIILEGPLGDRSSYLLSFRRSYLDLLINSFDLGTSSVPHYGDIQAKIIYEANSSNKLSLLVFQSDDHLKSEAEDASENDMVVYGNQDISELTTGVNWRYLWNKSAYSNTSIAITRTAYDELFYETGTDQLLEKNRSSENTLKFRNSNFIRLKTNLSIEFGAEFKVQSQEFNNYFGATENTGGDSLNAALLVSKTKTNYRALFLQLDSEFYKNWSLQFGLRSEYRSYHDSFTLSPRFSLRYQFDPQQKVIVSYGRYYQSLPAKLNELNQTELELPSSDH
ncbi:MAG: TonB-dependent receptor, partial [Calditrichaeota bacterium]|nr:TonB-dependent receptor [Calditrichota bacterium]